jgi:hypothetical protein
VLNNNFSSANVVTMARALEKQLFPSPIPELLKLLFNTRLINGGREE